MNEIIWHLSFSDWLISLSMMPSRSIHAVTKVKIYAHLSMLIAALFTVAKIWKEPKYPSVEESIKKLWYSIDQCGSVFWASSCKAKSHWFDSSQGMCLGCRFSPLTGCVEEATDRYFSLTSMFLSISFSLPSPLSKNK